MDGRNGTDGGCSGKKALSNTEKAGAAARCGNKKLSNNVGSSQRKNDQGRIDWVTTLCLNRRAPARTSELHYKERQNYPPTLHIIMVDVSGSTLRKHALAFAKGYVREQMEKAYLARWSVALFAFGGSELQILRPPSRVQRSEIERDLLRMKAGGGSPFSAAIDQALRLFHQQRSTRADTLCRLTIITDGRFVPPKIDLPDDLHIRIVDMERVGVRIGCCKTLAQRWQADYVRLS